MNAKSTLLAAIVSHAACMKRSGPSSVKMTAHQGLAADVATQPEDVLARGSAPRHLDAALGQHRHGRGDDRAEAEPVHPHA